ncbi:hypothetical protein ACFQ2M_29295 [Kitasatospora saccharophila]|uniref:hypothetical protein n=1 Tax=Kitasatospora saccharophila TaxID=407973 RepID=UPI00363558B3
MNEVPPPSCPVVMSCIGFPAASSTATIGTIASTNTSPETAAYDFHVQRRFARSTRGAFQSRLIPFAGAGFGRAAGVDSVPRSTALRSCSPVRLKRCWKSALPMVAPTETTAAPSIVPYTPSSEASTAPATAAMALAAT